MNKEKLSIIALLIVAFIWGSAFIGVDIALKAGWDVFPILAVRGLVGGLCTLPFALKYKFWKNKKGMISGLIMGIFFFIAFIFQTVGQDKSSIVNAAFLTVLYVAFAPLLLRIIFKEKQEKKVYIGALVSILGVFSLTILDSGNGLKVNVGDILVILGALFFAMQIIAAQKSAKYCNAITATTIQLLVMGVLSLISIPITGQTSMKFDTSLIAVLYCAIFSSALASFLQVAGQKHLSSSKASIIMALETLIAAALSFIISRTLPSIYVYIGGGLMFLSIIIIEVKLMKKLNLKNYKYILFDVDDTLLDFQKSQNESIKKAFESQGVTITEEVLEKYSEINVQMWKDYEVNKITTDEIFKTRFQILSDNFNFGVNGIEIEKQFRINLNESAYLIEGTIDFLNKIKNDYTLIIVTNGKKETQKSRLKLSGLDKIFNYIFISEEVGYKKPEIEFFEHVAKNVEGFEKDKAIIIGDSLTSDIQGGLNFDIDTCHYNYHKKEHTNIAKYTIDKIEELL